jgi:hypothetical protein
MDFEDITGLRDALLGILRIPCAVNTGWTGKYCDHEGGGEGYYTGVVHSQRVYGRQTGSTICDPCKPHWTGHVDQGIASEDHLNSTGSPVYDWSCLPFK